MRQLKINGAAALIALMPLLLVSPPQVSRADTFTVVGSSVAKGFNGSGSLTNGSFSGGYAGRLTPMLEGLGWYVTNVAIGGDTTQDVLDRFAGDVVPTAPDVLYIGLSLGNEGLAFSRDTEDSAGLEELFRVNMTSILHEAVTEGYKPVIGLNYANNNYAPRHYEFIKSINLEINRWNYPSVNLLGPLDDGFGRWAPNYWSDNLHPDATGHEEFFYAFVPTLPDALMAGKGTPDLSGSTGFTRLDRDETVDVIEYEPEYTMHSFTKVFRVRTTGTGTVASVLSTFPAPTILVDFGPDNDTFGRATASPDAYGHYWNSWRPVGTGDFVTAGTSTQNLLNTEGIATAIGIEVTEDFSAAYGRTAGGGLLSPEESRLGYLAVGTATEDYFFAVKDASNPDGDSSMKITGLDTAKSYTLRMFGSRSVVHKRQSRFTVQGAGSAQTRTMLSSGRESSYGWSGEGNNDTVVMFRDIEPDGSGEISITLESIDLDAGSEDDDFAYISLLEIAESRPSSDYRRFLIDFGPNLGDGFSGRGTTNPDANGYYWNSWREGAGDTNITTAHSLNDLVTVNNDSTGIDLEITSNFTGANGRDAGGLDSPDGPLSALLGDFAVETATEDYFFDSGTGAFRVTGLNTAATYHLRFFGCRASSAETRETQYIVSGANSTRTNSITTTGNDIGVGSAGFDGNDNTIAGIHGVQPYGDGSITVSVVKVLGSFAYLNALEIEEARPLTYGTVEVRDNAVVYTTPQGIEVSAAVDANDGSWYEVALAHSFAIGRTVLYIDGVPAGAVAEECIPARFVLGGPALASGAPPAPDQADYQDWRIYRAPWNSGEAYADHGGAMQQASLELCLPLDDANLAQGVQPTNIAQSLAAARFHATNASVQTAVSPPSSLQAVSYESTSIELTWTDNSSTESGFVIERREPGGASAWSEIAAPGANIAIYTNTGLTAGQTYEYRISSQEGARQSDYSEVVTATTRQDAQLYREFISQYIDIIPDGVCLIDFNEGSPDYGGAVWNQITDRSGSAVYSLLDTNGATPGYTLSITRPFDEYRSGTGSPLAGYAADAQDTGFFMTRFAPESAQIRISGLNTNFNYDLMLFGRRGTYVSGHDYETRYLVTGGNPSAVDGRFEAGFNTEPFTVFGMAPDAGRSIVIDVNGADSPTGIVFAGINMIILREASLYDSYLVDFSDNSAPVYPPGQAWNTVTNHTQQGVTYNLVDQSGDGTAGYTLTIDINFTNSRNSISAVLPGGFVEDAERYMFALNGGGQAKMTFSGLDTNFAYDFTLLSRRGSPGAGFNYQGDFTFTGANSGSVIVDAATNATFATVSGIVPDSSGSIVFTVDDVPNGDIEFPVLNLVRMTPAGVKPGGAGDGANARALADADADADGVPNGVEYWRGLSPVASDSYTFGFGEPAYDTAADAFRGIYSLEVEASDASVVYQSRTSLVSGTWSVDGGISETILWTDGEISTVGIQRAVSGPLEFFRLGVIVNGVTNYSVPSGYQLYTMPEDRSFIGIAFDHAAYTLADILGTNQFPLSTVASTGTVVDVWNQDSQLLTNRYWLSNASGFEGWLVDPGFVSADGVLVDPDKGLMVTIRQGAGTQYPVIAGTVPTVAPRQTVQSNGYTVANIPLPAEITLADSGLISSGFTGGSSFISSDFLLFYNNATDLFDTKIFYYTGDGSWRNADFTLATRTIRPGEAFLIFRRQRSADMDWTVPLPYSLP